MNKKDDFSALSDDELGEVIGGINWSIFGQKVTEKMEHDKYPELITAIARRDWIQVARIAIPLIGKGDESISKCAEQAKTNQEG